MEKVQRWDRMEKKVQRHPQATRETHTGVCMARKKTEGGLAKYKIKGAEIRCTETSQAPVDVYIKNLRRIVDVRDA